MAWSSENLKNEYDSTAPLYQSLCNELTTQLNELLKQGGVSLAFPIEARVKAWDSISEKCERNALEPSSLGEIGDVAGLRLLVLFRRDLENVRAMLDANFEVVYFEDTADRLAEDQFGYGSMHFRVRPKQAWLELPTLRPLQGLEAEIQLRTASQHIWAASSHVLQYKKEAHVPTPVRRSINRVAALLETVDLEFERVLAEREEYVETSSTPGADDVLDTELLRIVLDEVLPPENKGEDEDYAKLLDELSRSGVNSVEDLKELMNEQWDAVFLADQRAAKHVIAGKPGYKAASPLVSKGPNEGSSTLMLVSFEQRFIKFIPHPRLELGLRGQGRTDMRESDLPCLTPVFDPRTLTPEVLVS